MATESATTTATATAEALVINRTFNASAAEVFKAWTTPELVKKWWGPKGFTGPVANIDFREGGTCHLCMRTPEGQDLWSRGSYQEIIPNKKIVVTDSFADEKGNIIPASQVGMPGEWPLELLVTITLEESAGKTEMTIKHEGLPKEVINDCRTGWNESFDKMEKLFK
jgi:uncharacterized protein YndB with AHSA1/START domain